jgi:quinol monooxygenase YgiN
MIIELVGIVAPPEKREELGRAFSYLLGPTQAEPGCLSCLLYRNWADANVIYIESRWETLEDLTNHISSDAYKKLLLLMELGAEPPTVEFLTVTEVRGLGFIEAVRRDQTPMRLPAF